MRRIGVIGDIHGEAARLSTALDWLQNDKADLLLAVGDIVDGRDAAGVERCCALLGERGVEAVRGNHERWFLDDKLRDLPEATPPGALSNTACEFLVALPATRAYDTPRGRLLLCHGLGEDDMHGVKPDDRDYAIDSNFALQALIEENEFDIVINGHTHRRMVRTVGRLAIWNAGTLHRRYSPCFMRIDFESAEIAFFDLPEEGGVVAAERYALEVPARP